MSQLIMTFWVYVLPIPLCIAMYFAWLALSGSQVFALYVLLLPLFYGYVGPGIATNVLKKWRFYGPGVVGNYYIHHGFMYAANMSPLLFIPFLGCSLDHTLSLAEMIRILLCASVLHGFVLWIHDIYILRLKMVEVFNRPASEGKGPEIVAFHYAPLCFFMIGLTYSTGALVAFQVFVVQQDVSWWSVGWVSFLGLTLMFSVPSLVYRYYCK